MLFYRCKRIRQLPAFLVEIPVNLSGKRENVMNDKIVNILKIILGLFILGTVIYG